MTSGFEGGDTEIPPPTLEEIESHPSSVHGTTSSSVHGTTEPGAQSATMSGAQSAKRGGIITARGTGDGLVLRLDGRVERIALRRALEDFMRARRSFLEGQAVSVEWVGARPELGVVDEIEHCLSEDFGVEVRGSQLVEPDLSSCVERIADSFSPQSGTGFSDVHSTTSSSVQAKPSSRVRHMPSSGARSATREPAAESDRVHSLFDGVRALGVDPGSARDRNSYKVPLEGALWDEADARIFYTTLRSGQKVESEHSLVVFGDVNSGAEVISGGDIIVLGTLRGIAHAGAYDETGAGRIIFALCLQPTQLRIGSVISRGRGDGSEQAEIARVDGTLIVVEPYRSPLRPVTFKPRR